MASNDKFRNKIFTLSNGRPMDIVFAESQTKKHRNASGLGWLVTGLVIVGELAGGGIVALPNAVISAGFLFGFGMVVLFGVIATYTAMQLGDSWSIMQERWPLYRQHQRQPYAEMGYRAGGNILKHIITMFTNLALFGTTVVLVLLASKNISSFLSVFFNLHLNFCSSILVVVLVLMPLTFFKSPKDFWPVIVCAMIATMLAVVLIIVGSIWDSPTCQPVAVSSPSTMRGIFHAYGTLMFSYGGHGCFPTIVHDMRKPYHFHRTAIFSFAATSFTYLIISLIAYFVYGSSVQESVILSIQTVWVQQAINIVIALHVFLSITIMINPINQEVEEFLHVPHEFGWRRVAARCGTLAAVVFVAESMPHFGVVLDFFGGSAMMLITLVFPVICYLSLNTLKKLGSSVSLDHRPSVREVISQTPLRVLLLNGFIILVGVIGGIGSTVISFESMMADSFEPPCYIRPFLSSTVRSGDVIDITNCCGPGRNVSIYGTPESYCSIFAKH